MDTLYLKTLALRIAGGQSESYNVFVKSYNEMNDYLIKCRKSHRIFVANLFKKIAQMNANTAKDCNKYINFIETLNSNKKPNKFPEVYYKKGKEVDIIRFEDLDNVPELNPKEEELKGEEEDEEYYSKSRGRGSSLRVENSPDKPIKLVEDQSEAKEEENARLIKQQEEALKLEEYKKHITQLENENRDLRKLIKTQTKAPQTSIRGKLPDRNIDLIRFRLRKTSKHVADLRRLIKYKIKGHMSYLSITRTYRGIYGFRIRLRLLAKQRAEIRRLIELQAKTHQGSQESSKADSVCKELRLQLDLLDKECDELKNIIEGYSRDPESKIGKEDRTIAELRLRLKLLNQQSPELYRLIEERARELDSTLTSTGNERNFDELVLRLELLEKENPDLRRQIEEQANDQEFTQHDPQENIDELHMELEILEDENADIQTSMTQPDEERDSHLDMSPNERVYEFKLWLESVMNDSEQLKILINEFPNSSDGTISSEFINSLQARLEQLQAENAKAEVLLDEKEKELENNIQMKSDNLDRVQLLENENAELKAQLEQREAIFEAQISSSNSNERLMILRIRLELTQTQILKLRSIIETKYASHHADSSPISKNIEDITPLLELINDEISHIKNLIKEEGQTSEGDGSYIDQLKLGLELVEKENAGIRNLINQILQDNEANKKDKLGRDINTLKDKLQILDYQNLELASLIEEQDNLRKSNQKSRISLKKLLELRIRLELLQAETNQVKELIEQDSSNSQIVGKGDINHRKNEIKEGKFESQNLVDECYSDYRINQLKLRLELLENSSYNLKVQIDESLKNEESKYVSLSDMSLDELLLRLEILEKESPGSRSLIEDKIKANNPELQSELDFIRNQLELVQQENPDLYQLIEAQAKEQASKQKRLKSEEVISNMRLQLDLLENENPDLKKLIEEQVQDLELNIDMNSLDNYILYLSSQLDILTQVNPELRNLIQQKASTSLFSLASFQELENQNKQLKEEIQQLKLEQRDNHIKLSSKAEQELRLRVDLLEKELNSKNQLISLLKSQGSAARLVHHDIRSGRRFKTSEDRTSSLEIPTIDPLGAKTSPYAEVEHKIDPLSNYTSSKCDDISKLQQNYKQVIEEHTDQIRSYETIIERLNSQILNKGELLNKLQKAYISKIMNRSYYDNPEDKSDNLLLDNLQCQRNLQRLFYLEGHSAKITRARPSADGMYAISASYDKTVRIWDIYNKKVKAILLGHEDTVNDVLITSDNKFIISASSDSTIRIWSVEEAREEATLSMDSSPVIRLAMSSNDQYLISLSQNNNAILWDLTNRQQLYCFTQDPVSAVEFTADSNQVILGLVSSKIILWNIDKKEQEASIEGHSDSITSLAISKNGAWLASGSSDRTIRVWNLNDTSDVKVIEGNQGKVTSLSWSDNSRYIGSTSDNKTLRVWDAHNASQALRLQSHKSEFASLEFISGEHYILFASEDTLGVARI